MSLKKFHGFLKCMPRAHCDERIAFPRNNRLTLRYCQKQGLFDLFVGQQVIDYFSLWTVRGDMEVFLNETLVASKYISDNNESLDIVTIICSFWKNLLETGDNFFKRKPSGARSITLRNKYRCWFNQ